MSVTYSSGSYGSLSEEDAECVFDRLLNVLALRLEVKNKVFLIWQFNERAILGKKSPPLYSMILFEFIQMF